MDEVGTRTVVDPEQVGAGQVAAGQVDPDAVGEEAARRAQEVVGLYGDPDVTWGIALDVVLTEPAELSGVEQRLGELFARHPHLGPVPPLVTVPEAEWAHHRDVSACQPYGPEGLVRISLRADNRAVLVTAHHGVVDGFGMVALVAAVLDRDLGATVRGVGDRRSSRGFLVSSALRFAEALFAPPARFGGGQVEAGQDEPSERLLSTSHVPVKVNAAVACTAALNTHAAWPRRRNSGGRRFLAVIGASRREPGEYVPDRDTSYLRIALRHGGDLARVGEALRAAEPEPDFPETTAGGIGPWVMRRMKSRLGYTVNIANAGLFVGEGLESMALFPALNGPRAVGVGVVSTHEGATITLRVRRSEFSEDESRRLLEALVAESLSLGKPA